MSRRAIAFGIFTFFALAGIAWAVTARPSEALIEIWQNLRGPAHLKAGEAPRREGSASRAELVPNEQDMLRVPSDVVKTLGITTAPVTKPRYSRNLTLSGSLALDTNRLAHVHTRFAGEVVELGTVADPIAVTEDGRRVTRSLRFGDTVEKGQLLAVLWSSDLGEKKSEYVDTLSKLRLEKETLARLEALYKDESVPERVVREARRNVESAQIGVARVERTLRAWRLSDTEISAIRQESEAVNGKETGLDSDREKSWARVELKAPLAGTILEVNLAVGDIVATDLDLFKIADMRTLRVWAYVYEEDLPSLLALARPIHWTVRLKSDPRSAAIMGVVEKIGDIIDPNQHTALVVGQVENPDGRMRAGQFVTAQVELPTDMNEVELPITALVEDGQESIVFVQPDPSRPEFSMRHINVIRRSGKAACAHGGRLTGMSEEPSERQATPLQPGDRVVISGAVELKAALSGLKDDAKSTE